ncbi:uncharacterized protein BDZ99DRAFT_463299 [Mytilinidion resinicola]|uniref:BTB domain-containing protein n=1 Tax=Mytilinidion resinicola TaxID=574789 RepID=A0A6A6YLV2_9PEZI|nr:uncharacterized protein BDZ99DRAFT_463299 [Mytilinidion resinicola]KAF2809518.1 hypothetical protein BDZ99DRAFT_463299 [Mytilinidion resinicola]
MASSKKPRKARRPSFLTMGREVVNLKVGSEEQVYSVHQDLLAYHSEYFRALFKGSFREAQEKASALPDTDCRTFEIFMDWLYSGQFPWEGSEDDNLPHVPTSGRDNTREVSEKVEDGDDTKDDEDGNAERKALDNAREGVAQYTLDLFIMADRYNIPRLRHDALSHFFIFFAQDAQRTLSQSSVTKAFLFLPESSPMRTLICDLFCARIQKTNILEDARSALPVDFMFDALKGVQNIMKQSGTSFLVRPHNKHRLCVYHHHEAGDADVCEYKEIPGTIYGPPDYPRKKGRHSGWG